MSEEQSRAGIVSAALLHLGRDPIADLDAVNDQTAVLAKERYPQVRDALLRSYPWNFAMRFAALPGSLLPAPQFGFTHSCALPSGGAQLYCLRLWRLENPSIKYRVQGRELLVSAAPPITIAYVGRVLDEEQFDPIFCELLALDLALALINRVPSNDVRKRGTELRQVRAQTRRTASMTDAMESTPGQTTGGDTGSWLNARRPM
jgi:hypothetical protein